MGLQEALPMNKRLWEARTPVHVVSNFYDVPGCKAGKSSLTEIERAFPPDS